MADQDQSTQTGTHPGLQIPQEIREKFAAILALILGSESMNDEERQYWIDILPIMNQEQMTQLQTILQNEKDQLAAIDAKYSQEISKLGKDESIVQMENTRRDKQKQRSAQEASARASEETSAEELLKQLES